MADANNTSIWDTVGSIAPLAGAALPGILSPVAANQAAGGYQQAANTVGAGINTSGTSLQPFQTGGANANSTLQSLFGINGQPANAAAISAFESTPGFQFQEQQGDQAINRAAAASGNAFSSSTLGALANYNSGLAASSYQNYINNLFGLNSTGENAAVARGSQAIQGANYQGSYQANRGIQVGNGISGAAGSLPGVTAALSNPNTIAALTKLFGGGGAGGSGYNATDPSNFGSSYAGIDSSGNLTQDPNNPNFYNPSTDPSNPINQIFQSNDSPSWDFSGASTGP